MIPQEKAEELVEKMFNIGSALYAERIRAKECALIAAVETKLAFMEIADYDKASYWRLVELEIEKL